MSAFTFTVHGTPRPKARPRFVNGRAVTTTKPSEKLWRMAVERAVAEAVSYRGCGYPSFTGPVRVSMIFTFKPPLSKMSRLGEVHTQKPDGDNLAKPILDAMERCGVFRNDSQVGITSIVKRWGLHPSAIVIVEPIEARSCQASAVELVPPSWMVAP